MVCQKTRFEVFKIDGFTCQYCGRKSPEVILEADHIVPASKGGKEELGNLITSCRDCNRGKSNIRLITDVPQPDSNKLNQSCNEKYRINKIIEEKENELKQLYLLQKEAVINIFKAQIEVTQYKISNLTEDSMFQDPDYNGESFEEFIIKLYKELGVLELQISDQEFSNKVNIELKLDLNLLYKNKSILSKKDVIRRVMEQDFQILPDAVDLILSTNNHERTISTLLQNIDNSIIVIDTEAVKKFAFVI